MVVVVEAGLGVVVLAGEPQRTGGVARASSKDRAPKCGLRVPGEVAVGVDQLGGGADQVGDDRVELFVDPFLGGVAQPSSFGLGEWTEAAGFPVPHGGPTRRVRAAGVGLFGEHDAVPGEGDLLGDTGAVGAEALFGDAPAQRVVTVAPLLPVRGGDRD